MATTIVTIKSDMSTIETSECIQAVAQFFKENRDDIKRIRATFPRSRPGVLKMALECGLDRLLEVCDYEESVAAARESEDRTLFIMSEPNSAIVEVYGLDEKDWDWDDSCEVFR